MRQQHAHPHKHSTPSAPSLPTHVPRFFVFPSTDSHYLRRLVGCGASQATACRARSRPQQPCDPVIAKQLLNPVANDLRGGLGAEVLLCSAAASHPQRVTTLEAADVVLLCPYLNYHELLGPGVGRGPPRCPSPEAGYNASARLGRFARTVKASVAWNASRPHVYLTNAVRRP
jgi:hypothetical protein